MEKATRTLLIKQSNGEEIQVDIPDDWKVTFGPLAAGIEKRYGSIPMGLRIYESEKMQRAVFADVVSFRDVSIPIRYKQVSEEGKEEWSVSEDSSKRNSSRKRTSKWVDDKTK